ncbi:uncharacterized protein LOC143119644 [Alosa pseudoharengus]|uniref:uncharacterized protein LOC143119644 n=1 Tax=Alosa pseudoharengus TaxID=34774 RepID=UPI003F89C99C
MSMPVPPLPARKCEAPARMCLCGNKILAADTHQVCAACLGLQHAQTALTSPEVCEHCARLSLRSRRRRLACLASLTDDDPMLGADDLPPLESATLSQEPAGAGELGASWGDQLDALSPISDTEDSPMGMLGATGEAELISEDDSVDLLSLGDEDGDDLSLPATQAARPSGVRSDSTATGADEAASGGLHDVCKRAAAKLGVPWPEAQKENVSSRYEGKRLPKAKSSTSDWILPSAPCRTAPGRPSPPHPEVCDDPLGTRIPLQSRQFPVRRDSELEEDFSSAPNQPAVWDEMCVVTDLCLRLHRCAVQTAGRAMALMVSQERARWLNLSSLSHKEKTQLLDVPVDPKGLFGPAVATMQKRCEEKIRDGEALQLCLPRKAQAPASKRQLPTQTATQSLGKTPELKARRYRLQFATPPPPFNGIVQSHATGEPARVLRGKIISLLNKQAIRVVPIEQSRHGFYSGYFLVPKKGGGLRPILDLRALNRYLRMYRFRMLTNDALMRFMRPGDWFTSGDLTDAFLHVPIYPPHRKFLRFAFRGVTYEWLALPFGLALSPRVFVKVTEAAIALLREKGLRLATFIDDWLVAAHSYQEAQQHTAILTEHLLLLGFRINWEESVLRPCQITMMAFWLALRHFLPILRGHHVLVRTDYTTVVAYVNKQGGLRSRHMHTLAHRLILWSSTQLLSLKATHVPGVLNLGADLLSRGNPRYGDWKLHSDVVAQIWLRTSRAKVDLFASEENAQCPMFFSLRDQKAPLGIDALAHQWPHVLLYAFPPLELITPTLARVREQSLSLILVAPRWPGKPWLAEIIPLLHSPPWPLPPRRDLLSRANGEIFHPHPERLALWVWPVKG